MDTKPGAKPHCGTSADVRVDGEALDHPGRVDVFGEVEVVGAGVARRGGDDRCGMERRGAHHHVLTIDLGGECDRVGDVDIERLHAACAQRCQRGLVAIDDGDVELGRSRQQLHDRLTDLACSDQRQLRCRRGIHPATVTPAQVQGPLAWHGRLGVPWNATTTARHSRADIALATWGLFVGLALLLLAAGLFGTLLGVRSELVGLPTVVSSLISAAYYGGFLVGSRVALSALGRVGHIRVYAALASLLSAAMLAVGLTESAPAWAWLRFVTGLCLAGQYVVAESWLNDLATNENRGRLLAIYAVVTSGAFGIGQVLLFTIDDALAVTGFAIASIITSLAVAPVALSEDAVAPVVAKREHISLRDLAKLVPTGVVSCLLVGMAHGALTGMAAIYATRVGLSPGQVGLFVAAPNIGGMLLHWPVSAASDDIDRRAVGARRIARRDRCGRCCCCSAHRPVPMALLLMAVLGGCSYPLYSIAAAYTNDWIDPEHVNAAASQLVTLYGVGAMVGPFVAAGMMIAIGPEGFFWSAIVLHGMLAAFFVYRLRAWRAPLAKRPWSEVSLPARAFFVPATVVAMGRRYRDKRGQ